MANDSLDFVQRGKVSIVRRQYADAVKICRLGLLAHPTLVEGRLVLGMALTALGRWDEVLAEMRVALEVEADNALAWLLKGEALVGKADYVQAETVLRRAKELDPSNTKADQLLAEIQVARAAGFEGIPAEPTDTKVYPAKAAPAGRVDAPSFSSGSVADLPDGGDDENDTKVGDEVDENTDVDPDAANRPELQRIIKAASEPRRDRKDTAPPLAKLGDDIEEPSTEMFLPPGGGHESSYEPPAPDDYAERPRPPVPAMLPPSLAEEPSRVGTDTSTPLEMPRHHVPPGRVRPSRADVDIAHEETEPSIELSASDLIVAESGLFDVSDESDLDEQENTLQRGRRRRADDVDTNAGTRPETPEPRRGRSSYDPRSFDPPSFSPEPEPMPVYDRHEAPTGATQSPPSNGRYDGTPGVVRVPLGMHSSPQLLPDSRQRPMPKTAPSSQLRRGVGARLRDALGGGSLWVLITAVVAVIAVGVVAGLFVREWRMRARVARRYDLARQRLQSGNYPGFQAAELLYRQILAERDDPQARALRARTLAQMAFEFGDAPDQATRAVAGLGDADTSAEAQAARVYLALANGELDRAGRLATAIRRKAADATASYLVGRTELLLERPDSATEALRAAADGMHDAITLHALGLAEAAAHHEDRAFDAYRQALAANANHIATIVDRAVLQVRRGGPAERELARGALEGVVTKLVNDASPGQLARAYLGLAELELASGSLEAARRDLQQAASKRRDGDALLEEELAATLLRTFELDAAEKEAKRAVSGFGSSARIQPKLILAQVALSRGRPAQALEIIEEAGTSRPEALVLRARAQLKLGRKEAARLDAESALRVAPDLVGAKVALARVDIADGHPERAIRDLDKLDHQQKLAEVADAMGEAFARTPDRARSWFEEALRRDPLDLDARLQLARSYRDGGKLDEARAELGKLLQLNAAYVPARRELAYVALDQGDGLAARDQLDALGDKEPDLETLVGAARAHLLLGDGAGAEQRLKKAEALPLFPSAGPQAEEVADLHARALVLQHRPDEAVQVLNKVVAAAQRGETGGLLMMAYLELDQPDKAAAVRFRIAPRLFTAPEVLTARARLAIERGKDVSAEALAEQAILRLQPRPNGPPSPLDRLGARRWVRAEAYTVLGRSQYEQGAFRPALKALKSAADLDPHAARAFYYLGLVLQEVHRLPDARQAMETAVKNDPKFGDALYSLARLRQDMGDAKAKEAFEQYLQVAPKGIYAEESRKALAGAPPVPPRPTSSQPRKRRRGR